MPELALNVQVNSLRTINVYPHSKASLRTRVQVHYLKNLRVRCFKVGLSIPGNVCIINNTTKSRNCLIYLLLCYWFITTCVKAYSNLCCLGLRTFGGAVRCVRRQPNFCQNMITYFKPTCTRLTDTLPYVNNHKGRKSHCELIKWDNDVKCIIFNHWVNLSKSCMKCNDSLK